MEAFSCCLSKMEIIFEKQLIELLLEDVSEERLYLLLVTSAQNTP